MSNCLYSLVDSPYKPYNFKTLQTLITRLDQFKETPSLYNSRTITWLESYAYRIYQEILIKCFTELSSSSSRKVFETFKLDVFLLALNISTHPTFLKDGRYIHWSRETIAAGNQLSNTVELLKIKLKFFKNDLTKLDCQAIEIMQRCFSELANDLDGFKNHYENDIEMVENYDFFQPPSSPVRHKNR